MGDVPFLGCKISLISKCDIRYEGILYSVDAKESTIALSKVKSYGTETRGDPNCFVAPKNDIYDIIIFRASDVKDLRVDAHEPPGLSDPAIISVNNHKYPGQTPSTSSFINPNSSNSTNNATNTGAPTLNSNGSLSTSGPSNQQQQKHQHQKPLLPFLPTGSQQDQPLLQQSLHQSNQQSTINYSSAVSNAHRRNRPDQREKRPEDVKKQPHEPNRDGVRRDDRRPENKRIDDRRDDRRNDRRDDRRDDKRDDRRGGSRERRDEGGRRDGRSNMRISRGGYDNNRNHVNSNMRYNNNSNYTRRGSNNRDNNSKSGAPNYRRGPPPGVRRGRSNDRTGAPRGTRKTAPLKFEGEYDFEEANKVFLDLEGKLKNLKLKDEKDGPEPSGDRADSKSPAAQSVSGSGYDSDDQIKDGDSKDGHGSVCGDFYDRTKSFFDNISCEASERSQGKVNKPNWRKERELNTETFGVSGYYRRGGYRGRSYGANGYHRR